VQNVKFESKSLPKIFHANIVATHVMLWRRRGQKRAAIAGAKCS